MKFSLYLLSRYRAQLMGIAIFLILVYHIPHNWFYFTFSLKLLRDYIYFGVDIFFFLSGFGVYFAYYNAQNLKNFYLQRIRRILPYCYPVMLVSAFVLYYLGRTNIVELIEMIFVVDFWIEGFLYDWFIPVILLFYLLTPPLIKFLKKNGWQKLFVIYILCNILILFLYQDNNSLVLARFPLYCAGIVFADMLANGREIKSRYLFMAVGVGLLLLGVNYWFGITGNIHWEYYSHYTAFFFLVPPICLFIAKIFSLTRYYDFPFLAFLGRYSLCIYIIHLRVLFAADVLITNRLLATVCVFVISIALAYVWQNLVSAILKRYWK
ncbi:MAG: acyltransferase [Dysgonomonas sp.]|nr:acyltransferase [Dysgonomonas sp.]